MKLIWRRKYKTEKEARQFMAFIQVILVQEVGKLAEKEGKDVKEAGILALLHGIALLFLNLERANQLSFLDVENMIRLKEQIIMVNMNFAFGKKEVTNERIEEFSKLIYEILKLTGLNGTDEKEIVIERIGASLCETLLLKNKENVQNILRKLQEMTGREISRSSRLQKTAC